MGSVKRCKKCLLTCWASLKPSAVAVWNCRSLRLARAGGNPHKGASPSFLMNWGCAYSSKGEMEDTLRMGLGDESEQYSLPFPPTDEITVPR